jgi:hypothetical protein
MIVGKGLVPFRTYFLSEHISNRPFPNKTNRFQIKPLAEHISQSYKMKIRIFKSLYHVMFVRPIYQIIHIIIIHYRADT